MTHNPAEALREALEPFATFAQDNVDEHGWTGIAVKNDRIVCWFGPSDFRRAAEAFAALTSPAPAGGEVLTFRYRNHRGEIAVRRAQECSLRYGSSEWYPERQWLLWAFDVDKSDYREFAVKNILSFGGELPADVTTLITVIADIREKSGVGSKPMLSELADAIAARIKPSASPDVVVVVERLRTAAGLLPFSDLKSDLTLAERAMLLSAATLLESLSAEKGRLEAAARLRPMSDAPKNRTPVLLQVKASLPRDDLRRWEGLQFVGHHSGNWDDGFDPGWNMSAPVGHGGFPDEWFDGWRPLIARTALTPKEKA